MDPKTRQELIDFLSGFVTDNKLAKFDEVLAYRTRYVTVALENIYQPHNASAVMRSCDLFGVQDVHIIENTNRFTVNPGVTVGSSKWLNLHRYNTRERDNTAPCLVGLKQQGYTIVATTPHQDDVLLPDLPIVKPIALVYGTEDTGLSDTALELADVYMKIPQVGFTESFNISVSVALSLYDIVQRVRDSDVEWQLSEEEKTELRLAWLKKVLKRFQNLEGQFFAAREK
ncbi:RNA methyltransferase [bacterium]|nr:RNA methyltransferase [bacterium]